MHNPNTEITGLKLMRAFTTAAAVCAVCLCLTIGDSTVLAQPATPKPAPSARKIGPASPAVGRSIAAGLKFLLGARDETGRWSGTYDRRFPGGVDSLVVTTGLSLGLTGDSPELAAAIKSCIAEEPKTVYACAMRLTACSRLGADKFGTTIERDAELIQARQSIKGGWGYGKGHPTMQRRPKWTDMCNTTFAVLSLSDAAAAGAKIKEGLWKKAADYVSKVQNPDGGWGYEPAGGSGLRLRGNSFGSMTACGISSLTALIPKLDPDDPDIAKYRESIDKGRKWLAQNYEIAKIPKWGWGEVSYWPYFYVYMLSRVAVESGSAQIGEHAWQGDILGSLLSRQSEDGAWRVGSKTGPADVIHTCFALMSLSNARKPVLVNKLVLAGQTPDGGDISALAGWLGQSAKRDARWQFVPATASQGVIDSAAVLYIAPAADSEISETLAGKIRLFALRGGMVLVSVPQGDGGKTQETFLAIFKNLQHTAALLTSSDPAFGLVHKIPDPGTLSVTSIGDSCRRRVFLVSGGYGQALSKGPAGGSAAFSLAANLAAYSGIGFATDSPRVPTPVASFVKAPKGRSMVVARVKHQGDWAVGPTSMIFLHNTLAKSLSIGVQNPVVSLEEPLPATYPLLWLTGTKMPAMSLLEQKHLGEYLSKGGMIFADSAMGKPEFARQLAVSIAKSVGVAAPVKVTVAHPFITGKFAGGIGVDLTKAVVRNGATPAPLADSLLMIKLRGRVVGIVSQCAITVPMDGGYTYGCIGPSAIDARRLAANVALYAATQSK